MIISAADDVEVGRGVRRCYANGAEVLGRALALGVVPPLRAAVSLRALSESSQPRRNVRRNVPGPRRQWTRRVVDP